MAKRAQAQAGDMSRLEMSFDKPHLINAVFGEFDRNLVTIENRLGVYISARGNRVQIEGEAGATARTRDILNDIYSRVLRGENIDAEAVQAIIAMTAEPTLEGIVRKDVSDAPGLMIRYRNGFGQLMEHSPFCERDIRKPQDLETHDEQGKFLFYIKKQDNIYPYYYLNHPFDAVGWDGYVYPYAFSIHNFEPITGRVHQPPPVHQTFEARNFVICSFVPRLFDYHPLAIPAPYNHSNIDSDEVLYYVDGDFMSRKHVERGMITLHPGGIPHGPHPGTVEKSIGAKETRELAVMIDTFRPLKMTEQAVGIEDANYYQSWLT